MEEDIQHHTPHITTTTTPPRPPPRNLAVETEAGIPALNLGQPRGLRQSGTLAA